MKILLTAFFLLVAGCATTRPFDTTNMDIGQSQASVTERYGQPDYTAGVLTPDGNKLIRYEFRHANYNRTIYDPPYEILQVLFYNGKVVAWGRPDEISLRQADVVIEQRFR
ncbi:MAG: hypothetical protein WBZ48_09720 [Bacteroidota bacterium]